ncbi:MAG: hypothetical protein HC837_10425 [Chloroflexaceae bacterium]|nr:hypothetical protein [Chloroflexaceae bacterium]
MHLYLQLNRRTMDLDMERTGKQVLTVGEYHYRPANIAQRVRKLTSKMWEPTVVKEVLAQRIRFETPDNARSWVYGGDSGSFSPYEGALVMLGCWDEETTVGIALHELAHEMHLRSGYYEESDEVIREALAIMAEREAGLMRVFEQDPYHTASNLIAQLADLWAFQSQPFSQRWNEMIALTRDIDLADLVNYYLDRNEGIGLGRWMKRYSKDTEMRETVLLTMATCSLRYSLNHRRCLLRNLIRCKTDTPIESILHVFDAIIELDSRYPEDDIKAIIDFCFAPINRNHRGLSVAFG